MVGSRDTGKLDDWKATLENDNIKRLSDVAWKTCELQKHCVSIRAHDFPERPHRFLRSRRSQFSPTIPVFNPPSLHPTESSPPSLPALPLSHSPSNPAAFTDSATQGNQDGYRVSTSTSFHPSFVVVPPFSVYQGWHGMCFNIQWFRRHYSFEDWIKNNKNVWFGNNVNSARVLEFLYFNLPLIL